MNLPPEKGTQTSERHGESVDALAAPLRSLQGGEHGVHVGPPGLVATRHTPLCSLSPTP